MSTIFSCSIAVDGIYRYGYYLLYLGIHTTLWLRPCILLCIYSLLGVQFDDIPLPLPVRVVQMLNSSLKNDIIDYIDKISPIVEAYTSEIGMHLVEIKSLTHSLTHTLIH